MNEKGFTTIFGLCLLLALALVVQGIQTEQMNQLYETAYCQAEFDLQNAADSGIYAAVDKVLAGEVALPAKRMPYRHSRREYQHDFDTITKTSKYLGTITVKTWGEQVNLNHYNELYPSYKRRAKGVEKAYIFFSMATAEDKHTGGQVYRCACAYILASGDQTIHFME